MHEMQFSIDVPVAGTPDFKTTQCFTFSKSIQFAGIDLLIAEDLEIHTDATDDGIEFLITAIIGGDEYGVIRTDMSPADMQESCWAASEMLAWHKHENQYIGGYDDYDFE